MLRKNFFLSSVISILICASLVISVKADVVTWHQTYGGAWNDYPSSVVETTDGGFVLACTLGSSFDEHNTDFWLIKVDAFGNVVWDQTYGGSEYNNAGAMVATSDGGYALAGSIYTSMIDAWLVKTDSFGNMVWNQTYGGTKYDWASSLLETPDKGYVFAGATESFAVQPSDVIILDHGYMDAWLVKTDSFGNMVWNRTYGDVGDDAALSLVATSDGGYAFAGYVGSEFDGAALLVKTDAAGNMVWNQTFGGGIFNSLVATSDGGYALAGTLNHNFWLVKTDSFGNMVWNQTYGTETLDKAYSLVATSDGGYMVAGTTLSFGAGHSDILLIKTDEYGVAPEAAWVVLPFLLAGTLAVFISKKKLFPKRS